jgi:hypothetical protein
MLLPNTAMPPTPSSEDDEFCAKFDSLDGSTHGDDNCDDRTHKTGSIAVAKKKKTYARPYDVSIEFEGKSYSGTYTVENGMVYVSSSMGSKATQVGGSPHAVTARRLLRELARVWKG